MRSYTKVSIEQRRRLILQFVTNLDLTFRYFYVPTFPYFLMLYNPYQHGLNLPPSLEGGKPKISVNDAFFSCEAMG